jgi:hypothetical protein
MKIDDTDSTSRWTFWSIEDVPGSAFSTAEMVSCESRIGSNLLKYRYFVKMIFYSKIDTFWLVLAHFHSPNLFVLAL